GGGEVMGSARVAYWSGRGWVEEGDELVAGWRELVAAEPRYVVGGERPLFQLWRETGWWQERYEPAYIVHYEGEEFVLWAYQPTLFDVGRWQDVSLRSDLGWGIEGYRLGGEEVVAGEGVAVSVRMVKEAWVETPVRLVVLLVDRETGQVWGQVDGWRPASQPLAWVVAGEVVEERAWLGVPAGTPAGWYEVVVGLRAEGEVGLRPWRGGGAEPFAMGQIVVVNKR
ncbi:MAG TPA: hypothetical protein VLL52_09315, partial [Anaerolineae bacterium]|nr:hypothetical protein [Anaerolineae bacterium]